MPESDDNKYLFAFQMLFSRSKYVHMPQGELTAVKTFDKSWGRVNNGIKGCHFKNMPCSQSANYQGNAFR